MLVDFKKYIVLHKLLEPSQKVLVAVSGGPDSVALFHLLFCCGYQTAIVHANFGLRAGESDADEEFVRNLANNYKVPFYFKRFETKAYQADRKISLQMAARDLRHGWFSEIANQYAYDAVALGHHQDDQVETFFINLFRGSGLRGMKAMEPKTGLLIRPLLYANQEQIFNYLRAHKLDYRTDSSNLTNKYLRNKIRNQLLSAISDIEPTAAAGIKKSIEHLQLNYTLYEELAKQALIQITNHQNNLIEVNKSELLRFVNWPTLLWELLSQYRFDGQLMPAIVKAVGKEPGKIFFSTGYRLVVNRETLELAALEHIRGEEFKLLHDLNSITSGGVQLGFEQMKRTKEFTPDANPCLAFVDHDLIRLPLAVRTWHKGDRFLPLGLKGSKLVSDYFTDQKFSLSQKEEARLLCNANGDIIWLIGHRLDNRYRIKAATKSILKISCKNL
jgi:tRNA(Ile)-lysidine synthase